MEDGQGDDDLLLLDPMATKPGSTEGENMGLYEFMYIYIYIGLYEFI